MSTGTSSSGSETAEQRGQAVYSPLVLSVYDTVVLRISNTLLWRCPTSELRALYDRNVRERHVDIGVGTGYYLDHATWPTSEPQITLVDLNENSLAAAAQRIVRYAPQTVAASVLHPLPLETKFSSVGLCYLLHCLPGPMREKAPVVFQHVGKITEPGANIFGATILQGAAPRSWPAQKLMDVYNARGIFSNVDDRAEDLQSALDANFTNARVTMRGAVAIFEAQTHPEDA